LLLHSAGLGVTKFLRLKKGALQGMQLTPRAAFETTRKGEGQNIMFDGDVQFFFTGLLRSIKQQNFERYAKRASALKQVDIKLPVREQAQWGFQILLFLGTESGGRRSSDTVKASEGDSKIEVPTYSIVRIRPKMDASIEWKRLSLSLSVTPRYLFTEETVTKEHKIPTPADPAKLVTEIFLRTASKWRPYGEATLSVALDHAQHFAISSTYKLGSQPPNFSKIDTIQSGLTLRY